MEGHQIAAIVIAALAYYYLFCGCCNKDAHELVLDDDGFLVRQNLRFTLKVQYKGDKKPSSMGVRGNGLGLSWDSTTPLQKSQEEEDVWSTDIVFKSSPKGYSCQDCSDQDHFLPTHSAFEFRFFHDGVEEKGPNHKIRLPVSRVSEAEERRPQFKYYPYFFDTEGKTSSVPVTSKYSADVIGTRSNLVYYPPGFDENPRDSYDVTYMLDAGFALFDENSVKGIMDKIFNSYAEGQVLIGFGDYDTNPEVGDPWMRDRTNLLTPVKGMMPMCKTGSIMDQCSGCVKLDPATAHIDDQLKAWFNKECFEHETVGGHADEVLDYLTKDVFDTVNAVLKKSGRTKLSKKRTDTTIVGYSLGGLVACHAAITRPQTFGKASCMSGSFWWPMSLDSETGRITMHNYTMKKTLNDITSQKVKLHRLPQKILIDVGDDEDSSYLSMLGSAREVFKTLAELSSLKVDENLWFQVYPGEKHGVPEFHRRLWNTFKILAD